MNVLLIWLDPQLQWVKVPRENFHFSCANYAERNQMVKGSMIRE